MVDDHAIFRSGVRRLLSDETDMRIIAEAGTGLEAIQLLRQRVFSLVLLDINMQGRSGLETLRRIRSEWPGQPVIMLSMYPEEQYAAVSLEAGANGYLSKDHDVDDLVVAIRIAASGGYYLPVSMKSGTLLQRKPASEQPPHYRLTERESQILRLIVQGKSLTDIGTQLCLSVKTVSTYRSRLLAKLGLGSNAELVRYCLERGIE